MGNQRYIGSGQKYIHYTDAQMAEARRTDMIDFLKRKEGFDFDKTGSVYVCKQHDSLIIQADRQRWYWNSQNEKGLNVIDWLQKIDGYSVKEAFQIIIGMDSVETTAFTKAPTQTNHTESNRDKSQAFSPPGKADDTKKVKAYLCSTRCIDPHIVNYCILHELIYQDSKYGNAVFLGLDESGKARFAESKCTNTYTSYRPRNVSGSDKRYSFNLSFLSDDSDKDRLYVFEAPVDALSHATMTQISENIRAKAENRKPDNNIWKRQNRLSLSGCSSVALDSYLERYPQIKKLDLCLDNDEAGIEACEKFIEKFGDKYDIHIHRVKGAKDYNECLQNFVARQKAQKQFDNSGAVSIENNVNQRKR